MHRITSLLALSCLIFVLASSPAQAATPVVQDQQNGMSLLLSQAEAGDIEACYQVALEYATRSKPSFEQATLWGKKAALAGHVGAQFLVGFLYGASDRQRAIVWTKLAADRGSARAQSALSVHYTEIDKAQAAKWLILADRAGDRDVAFWLEWGLPNLSQKDRQKAIELARAWKPVCPDNCKTFIVEKCGICPLTDEERRVVNTLPLPLGHYLFGGDSSR